MLSIKILRMVKVMRKRGEEGLSILEKIKSIIPSFKGYEEKESRRRSDRLVRDFILRSLDSAERNFKEQLSLMPRHTPEDMMMLINIILNRIQRIEDIIKSDRSGYVFFDAGHIERDKIYEVMKIDLKILRISRKIADDSSYITGRGLISLDARNRLMMIIESLKILEESLRMRIERFKIL